MLAVVEPGRGRPQTVTVRGARVMRCPAPAGDSALASWRRERLFRALRKSGVRRAVVPPAWQAEAAGQGLRPVAVWPLRQAVLMDVLRDKHGVAAAIRAPWPCPAAEEAAMLLARNFRYLRLDVPRSEGLERALLRRFGVSGTSPGAAELTVSFGGPPETENELCMGEDCALYQTAEYGEMEGLQGLIQTEGLLAALWSGGYIKKEEICLKTLASRA